MMEAHGDNAGGQQTIGSKGQIKNMASTKKHEQGTANKTQKTLKKQKQHAFVIFCLRNGDKGTAAKTPTIEIPCGTYKQKSQKLFDTHDSPKMRDTALCLF